MGWKAAEGLVRDGERRGSAGGDVDGLQEATRGEGHCGLIDEMTRPTEVNA